jgi:hypothetical protein
VEVGGEQAEGPDFSCNVSVSCEFALLEYLNENLLGYCPSNSKTVSSGGTATQFIDNDEGIYGSGLYAN